MSWPEVEIETDEMDEDPELVWSLDGKEDSPVELRINLPLRVCRGQQRGVRGDRGAVARLRGGGRVTTCHGCGQSIGWWQPTISGPALASDLPTAKLLSITRKEPPYDDMEFHARCAAAYSKGLVDGYEEGMEA